MPGLLLVGADYRVAPFDIRSKLAVTRAELGSVLSRLSSSTHIREVFLLSTHDRTEVYLRGHSSALDDIRLFWQERSGPGEEVLTPSLYQKRDEEAVYHLFSQSAGVDGSSAGGRDILPLIKGTLEVAREAGTVGSYLEALVSRTLKVARRVRREIGPEPTPLQVGRAQESLQQEADRFIRWARSRRATSAIDAMSQRAEEIRQSEILKLEAKLRQLSPEEREALETLTLSIVNKLLHPTKKALKEAAESDDASDYLRAASELFDLDEP